MRTIDHDEVIRLTRIATWVESRSPKDWLDYGDQGTVGLQLKRRMNPCERKENDFGVFAGKFDGVGFVVFLIDWNRNHTTGEVFETANEMREQWELD